VLLDGSDSADSDGDALTFVWSLNSYPSASGLRSDDITGANNTIAQVTPDAAGVYIFDLAVSDSIETVTDSVKITVTDSGTGTGTDPGTVPAAPTGLSVGSPTESTLMITWNTSSGATSYELYRNGGTIPVYTGPATTYTDTQLSSNTTYSYSVLAANTAGKSAKSSTQSGTTSSSATSPPPTPTGLAVSEETVSSLKITWDASATATSYRLYKAGVPLFTDTTASLMFVDDGLPSGTSYSYTVRAINSRGPSAPTAAVVGTTLLTTPTGLSTSGVGETTLTVAWNPVTSATRYELYRDAGLVFNDTTPNLIYNDTGLAAGTSYSYEVKAFNADTSSALSAAVTVITKPSTPANLVVGGETENTLTITWDASAGANAYELYRDASAVPIYVGSATGFTDTGLTSATLYGYKVLAKNSSGSSAQTATAVTGTTAAAASVAPDTPTVLAASGQTESTLTLTWNASSGATSYELYRSGTLIFNDTTLARAYTDTGLAGGTTYSYTVLARNSFGPSAQSGPFLGLTTPNSPSGLAVSGPTETALTLSWNASTSATSYDLYRDGALVFADTVPNLTYTDAALATGTSYGYTVLAKNTSGSGSESGAVTGTTIPATPGNLAASGTTETSITLTWDSEVGATSYQLLRDAAQIYSGLAQTFTDTGLTAATSYDYTVKSTNSSGSSAVSAAFAGTTDAEALSVPVAPTGLIVGGATVTTLDISWNATPDATSYQLFRDAVSIYIGSAIAFTDTSLSAATTYVYTVVASNSQGAGPTSVAVNGTTVPSTPTGLAVAGATETSLVVSWNASTGATSYELYRDGALAYAGGATTFTDTGRAGGTTYSYRVQSTSASGSSPQSSAAAGITIPSNPGGLSVDAQTETTLDLSWNPTTGTTSYELYRDSVLIFVDTTNQLNFADTGLTASTTYTYKVLAINSSGMNSLAGAPAVSGTTSAPAVVVPGVPTGLTISGETESTLNIGWDAVAGATKYELYRDAVLIFTDATGMLAYTDSMLSGGTSYDYTVLAANSAGPSAQSAAVAGTTIPNPPTGLLVTAPTESTLTISWAPSPGATLYTLYRDGAIISANATSPETDVSLSGGRTYAYEVVAKNASGASGPSTTAFGLTVPVSPILAVSSPTESTLTITWVESPGAASYELYRDTSAGGSFATMIDTGIEGTTYTDASLIASTQYYYKARAWNSAGYSQLSATAADGTTLTAAGSAPVTPVGLRVVETFDDSITMAWNPVATATSYELFRDDGSTNGQVYSGSALSINDSGLKKGTSYSYTVQATNALGSSAVSPAVAAVTIPKIPTGLAAGSPTTSALTISWDAPTGADGYQLMRATAAGGPYANVYTGPAETITVAGLASGTTYYFKVAASNAGGVSDLSGYSMGTTTATLTPPGAPLVDGPTVSSLEVQWGPTGAPSYVAYRDTNRFGDFTLQVYSGAASSFTDGGLQSDRTYFYKIKASAAGALSDFSPEGSGTTMAPVPATPTGLTVSGASQSSLYVSWNAAPGATGYYLHMDGTAVAGYDNTTTHFTAAGLAADTTYVFNVKAFNASGESVSSTGAAGTTAAALLSPPTTVTVAGATMNSLDVAWTAVAGADSYKVYRERDGDGFMFATEVSAPTVTITDGGLLTGTDYAYKVRAVNAAGDSPYSTQDSGMTLGPKAPGYLWVDSETDSTLYIGWDPSADAVSYKVYRSIPNDASGFAVVATPSETMFTDTGLQPDSEYFYRVTAVNSGAVESSFSEIRSRRTQQEALAVPDKPSGLGWWNETESSMEIGWDDMPDVSFKLYRSPVGAGTWVEIYTGTATSFRDTSLSAATSYDYQVTAVNSLGESIPSDPTTGTTLAAATVAPVTPANLRVQGGTEEYIELAWDTVPEGTTYQLERSADGLTSWVLVYDEVTNWFRDSVNVFETPYYYRVSATNTGGSSEVSASLFVGAGELVITVE
jgi:fibronectin type 3 domain-containing protein